MDSQGFFSDNWEVISFYLPIGIIGLWRWGVWFVRKSLSLFYRPIQGTYSATLSVVTPVYNEDPKMFKRALESWQQNEPEEIIAVIDYTDKKCIKIFKDFAKSFPGAKLIVTKTPGKREALADGVEVAVGEIVALVDSDTIWTKNIKNRLLAPFADRSVGGVGPRQDVLKADTLARKLFRIRLGDRFFTELTYLAAMGNALTCLSGRTALYRRSAISGLMDELINETFLWKKCISGDDKCLTHLVQRDRWKVKYLADITVYTPGAPDLPTYVKQQVRWARNSWRSDLKAVFSKWLWQEKFLAFHVLDRFIQPFTLLLGPVYLSVALIFGHILPAIIIILWWTISRAIKIYPQLKEHPSDIVYVPAYITMAYILAVIKIYALLTVDKQSWITRWDKSRLSKFGFINRFMPYLATVMLVFFMFFVVASDERLSIANREAQRAISQNKPERVVVTPDVTRLPDRPFEDYKNEKIAALKGDDRVRYQVRPKDTLGKIRQRLNLASSAVILNSRGIPLRGLGFVLPGQTVSFAVQDLQATSSRTSVSAAGLPVVTYDPASNTLRVQGDGSVVTIPSLAQSLQGRNFIENKGGGEWFLKANLLIDNHVTLVIDGSEVSWLKMKSDPSGFTWIKSEDGSIYINSTKITSWNESESDFDHKYEDGRSYILAKFSGRMDIAKSELAYLGYLGLPNRGNPFGGPYGISWKALDQAVDVNLLTGSATNNIIHHNMFGLYTFGVNGVVFRNNVIFENVYYGIDPHDDSNHLVIEGNTTYNNGTHGIITSKRCIHNVIRNNISYGNKGHGIMLHEDSNFSLVENNIVYDNQGDGIAIFRSRENVVLGNTVRNNKNGVRVSHESKGNYIENNTINGNRKGVYFYEKSVDNFVFANNIKENAIGLDYKDESLNFIRNDLSGNEKQTSLKSL